MFRLGFVAGGETFSKHVTLSEAKGLIALDKRWLVVTRFFINQLGPTQTDKVGGLDMADEWIPAFAGMTGWVE